MTDSEDTHTREARKVTTDLIKFSPLHNIYSSIYFPDNKSSNETTSDSDEGRNA